MHDLTHPLLPGLTLDRYQGLLHAWHDFLSDERKSVNGSRVGPDHDSWPAFERKLASFDHYHVDSEWGVVALRGRLSANALS